jgi:hypothetical protein
MSIRLRNFQELCYQVAPHSLNRLPKLRFSDYSNTFYKTEITDVFATLGGKTGLKGVQLPDWHVEWEGGTAAYLDEEPHFNRYRGITLLSALYKELPAFPLDNYTRSCLVFEAQCAKTEHLGLAWSSPYSETLFGEAAPSGLYVGNGAPVWKLRAFTDFLADFAPLFLKMRLIRFSVWENLMINRQLVPLHTLLLAPDAATQEIIKKFITRKLQAVAGEK